MDESGNTRGAQGQPVGTGFGIAGFVLGLISVISFGYLGVLGILGLIFSILQLRKKKTGLAIAGLVLSIIGLVFLLIIIFVFAFAISMLGLMFANMNVSDFNSSFNTTFGSYSTSNECSNVDMEIVRINEADNSVVIRKNAGAEYIEKVIVYIDTDSSATSDVSSLAVFQERIVMLPSIEEGDWVRLKVFIDGKECFMSADSKIVS